jgi:hypothetical protein
MRKANFYEMLVIVPTKWSGIQDEKSSVLYRNKISDNLICTKAIEGRSDNEANCSNKYR